MKPIDTSHITITTHPNTDEYRQAQEAHRDQVRQECRQRVLEVDAMMSSNLEKAARIEGESESRLYNARQKAKNLKDLIAAKKLEIAQLGQEYLKLNLEISALKVQFEVAKVEEINPLESELAEMKTALLIEISSYSGYQRANGLCAYPGCFEPSYCVNLCQNHYQQLRARLKSTP